LTARNLECSYYVPSDEASPHAIYDGPVELSNFIAALRQADLVDLKWGDRGMLCGNPLPENPKVLTLKRESPASRTLMGGT
jgi:hypothetical protein